MFSHVNRLVYETDTMADAGLSGTGAFDTYMAFALYVALLTVETPPGILLPSWSAHGSDWFIMNWLLKPKHLSRSTCSPVSITPRMVSAFSEARSGIFWTAV